MMLRSKKNIKIWGFAFGYFAFYIPYCFLTKSLTQGLLPGIEESVSGFELLPITAVATCITMLTVLVFTGGWNHIRHVRVRGIPVPAPRTPTVVSGLAAAAIIATTTLNYTVPGMSILLALLLMRGGVLIMAPIVDFVFGRRVHVYSCCALGLSLAAVILALISIDTYILTLVTSLILAVYLIGYSIRLQLMTRNAKSVKDIKNEQFYSEEAFVAAIALILVPAVIAVASNGMISQELRLGFSSMLSSPILVPGIAIGFFYACLYFFGTHIYLDYRENTFCIPLNRCSSLLSGLVASVGLMILFEQPAPNAYQLTAASLIIAAIVILARSTLPKNQETANRIYLFICNRNASRSPMAEAICRSEFARALNVDLSMLESNGIQVMSAGLTADPGTPLKSFAKQALEDLNVSTNGHVSRQLSDEMIHNADRIYCMTRQQEKSIIERYPHASSRVRCLDPAIDIEEPVEVNLNNYSELAHTIRLSLLKKLEHDGELPALSKTM